MPAPIAAEWRSQVDAAMCPNDWGFRPGSVVRSNSGYSVRREWTIQVDLPT